MRRHKNTIFLYLPTCLLFFTLIGLIHACSTKDMKMRHAETLYNEGQFLLQKEKPEKAMKKFNKSLVLAKEAEYDVGVAHNLNEIGIYYSTLGNQQKARELITETVAIYRQAKLKAEVSKVLNNIALTYMREGQYFIALEKYEELLAWDDEIDNQLGIAITQYNVGLIYERDVRNYREARRRYMKALDIFKELNKPQYIDAVEENLRRLTQ